MKTFKWCPEIGMRTCKGFFPEPHSHICIRTNGAEIRKPQCDGPALYLDFVDLDPDAIRRTQAFARNPAKGEQAVNDCMNEAQARALVHFVQHTPDDKLIVVNCEAGVSRSPGVVLALRRHYGGDTEEIFHKACPNIHVTSMVTRALREAQP
jgi:hypothetical protein